MEKIKKAPTAFRSGWDFLASIRLTVVVLLVLAVTSIMGTLIPQNQPLEQYYQRFGEVGFRILYALDIFDMYHSWWFQLLIIVLAANILVCSIDRLKALRRILFVRTPNFRVARFRRLAHRPEVQAEQSVAEVRPAIEAVLGRRYRYSRSESADGGVAVFAESGRWTRLGVYIVHLSVLLLLMGALVGSLFGFDGFVNIPEGESVSTIRLRNEDGVRQIPFAIRCDDFEVSFYDGGRPREFRSTLTLLREGEVLVQKDIIVNDPLRYEGINIFQSSYGQMPADMAVLSDEGIALKLTSRASGMEYERVARPGVPVTLPEGGGTLVLERLLERFQFMGQQDLGQTLLLTVTPPDGEPAEVRLPVRFARFDRMRTDGRFVISVAEFPQRFYTGLQVTRDPGVPLVYVGFVLMILGCYVTFFTAHRQVCAEIIPEARGCRIAVSGAATKDRQGMRREVDRLSRRLAEALGAPPPEGVATESAG
jgi:cytochrome c biogenesis protein